MKLYAIIGSTAFAVHNFAQLSELIKDSELDVLVTETITKFEGSNYTKCGIEIDLIKEFFSMKYVVHWKYKDGSLSGHGEPISKEDAYAAVEDANAHHTDIIHWVVVIGTFRTFSMFKVYDYKGGELSSSVNISLDQIVGELLEGIEVSWHLPEAEMREFFNNHEIQKDIYASIDSQGFCGEIYEHKDGKLESIEPEYFLQFMADYILKNLEEDKE